MGSLEESVLGAGGAGIQHYGLVGGGENDGVHLQAVHTGGEGEGGGGQTGEVEQHFSTQNTKSMSEKWEKIGKIKSEKNKVERTELEKFHSLPFLRQRFNLLLP